MGLFELFKKKNSGGVAKDRLKLLLVSDRANCSPDVMEMIKNDIINVISKYMDIDVEGLDIQITICYNLITLIQEVPIWLMKMRF